MKVVEKPKGAKETKKEKAKEKKEAEQPAQATNSSS
jgi:hypothetical protein